MTGDEQPTPSSGTAGSGLDWWGRWWPRVLAVAQLVAGLAILAWETTHVGDRPLLQFWGVCLVMGAPATTVAVSLVGERLVGGGGSRPGGGR